MVVATVKSVKQFSGTWAFGMDHSEENLFAKALVTDFTHSLGKGAAAISSFYEKVMPKDIRVYCKNVQMDSWTVYAKIKKENNEINFCENCVKDICSIHCQEIIEHCKSVIPFSSKLSANNITKWEYFDVLLIFNPRQNDESSFVYLGFTTTSGVDSVLLDTDKEPNLRRVKVKKGTCLYKRFLCKANTTIDSSAKLDSNMFKKTNCVASIQNAELYFGPCINVENCPRPDNKQLANLFGVGFDVLAYFRLYYSSRKPSASF